MDDDDIPTLIETIPPANVSALEESKSYTVPLTIICGFLGAGKSTLVRRILSERHGFRIAVIMNDFGDTADIEAKTINVSSPDDPTAENTEEILELANGCLCCSIKDSGIAAIEKLMQRKGAFDHILLETAGLADPGPIASMFWQNEEFTQGLGRDIHLDGVVCVVDAVFGKQQIEEDHSVNGEGESVKQIAGADVVLVNKTDLVQPDRVHDLERLMTQVNPAAAYHRTVRSNIDLKHIMGIDAYTSRISSVVTDAAAPGTADSGHCPDEMCRHEGHTHPHHYEVRGISSLQVSIPILKQDVIDRLDEWIRTLLWEGRIPENAPSDPPSIVVLRCKGIFTTKLGQTYILQGVRSLYEISKADDTEVDVGLPDAGKLVLIGKGLDASVRSSLLNVVGRESA